MTKSWLSRRIKRRRASIALVLVLFLYSSVGFGFWVNQVETIFRPVGYGGDGGEDPQQNWKIDGSLVSEPMELLDAQGGQSPESGQQIGPYVLWVPGPGKDSPTILYLHGQEATIGKNRDHTNHLHELGCNVLLVDYRGFGKTFGKFSPSEASLYQDAETALNYLTEDLGFSSDQIFIFGHSLGGAVAIEMAQRHPEVAGLIVECTFTSIRDMAHWTYPVTQMLPLDILLEHPFNSLEKIGSVTVPVLIIHGDADAKVPCEMSTTLHSALRDAGADSLLLIEGGQHEDCCIVDLDRHGARIKSFLEDCLESDDSSK